MMVQGGGFARLRVVYMCRWIVVNGDEGRISRAIFVKVSGLASQVARVMRINAIVMGGFHSALFLWEGLAGFLQWWRYRSWSVAVQETGVSFFDGHPTRTLNYGTIPSCTFFVYNRSVIETVNRRELCMRRGQRFLGA